MLPIFPLVVGLAETLGCTEPLPSAAAPRQEGEPDMATPAEHPAVSTQHELHRNLTPRHINLIALGGAIGTGLFVATGASVSSAGPGGALLSYAIIGLAVYFVMNALGEMATHRPVPGAFESYSRDYVDPAFGFMMGWNYWYASAMTIAVELVAASIVMKFWFPDSSSVVWSALFLAILLGLNLFSARIFGEGEFWFAGIKIVTIIVFIIVGLAMIAGIMGGHAVGFQNWTAGEAPFVGGAMGTFGILMVAGFSFIGVEATAIAAGEADNPTRTMPKAINSVFWRILIFYMGAIFVMATLISYTDPNLLAASEDNIAASPFTLIFERAGMAAAASVMNAVILTSVLSAGNSTLYSGSRLVFSMARNKSAPRFFGKVSRHGVPVYAVVFTAVVSSAAFLTSQIGDSVVYTWLYNATGLAGFIAWLGICIAHLRFRAAHRIQGISIDTLAYKAKLFPVGTWYALLVCVAVIIGQGWFAISEGTIDWLGIVVAYVGLPLAVALYLGFKVLRRTRLVPLATMDLEPHEDHARAHVDERP